MSDLNDPRVLFAAERTLLAWSRTATGLMAFGFIIDRTTLFVSPEAGKPGFGAWLGVAFILLGVALCGISVFHYRRAIASLRPVEIPAGYWVQFSSHVTVLIGVLGFLLAVYVALS